MDAQTEGLAVTVPAWAVVGADTAEETDVIPGMAEACRRFPRPDEALMKHALRELLWGEHFIVSRIVPSKGGSDVYVYSLRSAAAFLLGCDRAGIGKGDDQMILLVDVDGFITWVRDVIGDEALADALVEQCPADNAYNDRLRALQMLVGLRMVQYGGLE